jgi:hypothetical protein
MTRRFEFVSEDRPDDVSIARWVGDFAALTPGWKRDDLWETQPRHVNEFAVGIGGVLYPGLLGLVWRLTEGRARLVLPRWDGLALSSRLGIPYDPVAWEYGIDYEQADWTLRDRGFVPAESFRRLGPDPQDYERAPIAAVMSTSTWADLISVIPIGDQSNTACLFGIAANARQRLIGVLANQQIRPSLTDVLTEPDDIFAVITQDDENWPARDSLVLAGREHIRLRLPTELDQLEQRIDRYLAETQSAGTQEEWSRAVERLASVDVY